MRNAAQVGPYLLVIPASTSATDFQTRSGYSYGWFECDLQGQVDFQLFNANINTLIGESTVSSAGVIEKHGEDVLKLSIVLSFEVEKLSELSTSHRRQN
jgi:hypothetical protein